MWCPSLWLPYFYWFSLHGHSLLILNQNYLSAVSLFQGVYFTIPNFFHTMAHYHQQILKSLFPPYNFTPFTNFYYTLLPLQRTYQTRATSRLYHCPVLVIVSTIWSLFIIFSLSGFSHFPCIFITRSPLNDVLSKPLPSHENPSYPSCFSYPSVYLTCPPFSLDYYNIIYIVVGICLMVFLMVLS